MERTIIEDLKKWKARSDRKPLIVQGVRQCGKTYCLKEFGRTDFGACAYFNFEKNKALASIFDYDFNCDRILRELFLTMGYEQMDLNDTLIFFDEIQECPQAVTSLKYFCEDKPGLFIVAAGSLLGPAIAHNNISFPVGKVEFLQMYPLSFKEFLAATGYHKELSLLENYDLDRKIPDTVATELAKACKYYYIVGGMPEAVQTWINTNTFISVNRVLSGILNSYAADFGKYLSPDEALKVGWIWDSVPVQLAKENNKFVFSHVKEGKRSAELETSLEWLRKAGLVYSLDMVKNPEIPLSFYADKTYFKLYMSDVGLLRLRSNLDAESILEETPLYRNFKGALTENFVMTELVKQQMTPYFWRSGNSAEVDFMVESGRKIVPVEAKAETNTKAKSFALFCKRYSPQLGIKLSMKNVGSNVAGNTLVHSVPLYLVWRLGDYVSSVKY